MKILSKEHILLLHQVLIAEYGGTTGLRDEGLLDSAINVPFQTFDGVDLFPDVVSKASRLGYGLIKNHPFLDGNKRIGAHAMLVLLDINNISLEYDDDELITVIMGVASGELSDEDLKNWLNNHLRN